MAPPDDVPDYRPVEPPSPAAAPRAGVTPYAPPVPPAPIIDAPYRVVSIESAVPHDDLEPDEDADSDEDEQELQLTLVERLRRLPPAPTILTAGSIGSLIFLLRAVTSHTTPVAVLMSAAVVTGLIFGADSVVSSIACWRASQYGESGRAVVLAMVGGIAALVCAGAFAGTLVMILVLNS